MKCSFCKREIEPGRGTILVRPDGKTVNLCSSKCMKNMKLGRKPSKLKWIIKEKKVKKVES